MVHPLLSDWLTDRSTSSYVFERTADRSGWMDSFPSYSRYLGVPDNLAGEALLRKAYQLCSQRVRTMLPGKNIPLYFHPSKNQTNSRKILVATKVLDSPLSVEDKIDVILGATTHEVLHNLYTNFSTRFVTSPFQKAIQNILEDERIETLSGDVFPGYAHQLGKLKYFYFDFLYQPQDIPQNATELFNAFFKLVRYPKYLTDEVINRHELLLSEIKEVLTPYPMEFFEVHEASLKITAIFEREFGKLSSPNSSGDQSKESDAQESPSEPESAAAREIMDKIAEALGQLASAMEKGAEIHVAKIIEKDDHIDDILAGNMIVDRTAKVFTQKAIVDMATYQQIRKEVFPAATLLAAHLNVSTRPVTRTITGLRSGKLDARKIVDAALGRETIYRQTYRQQASIIRLVLAIDESGSMSGEKIEQAQKVAILFETAAELCSGRLELFIYGFTSDMLHLPSGNNLLTVYRESGFQKRGTLGSVSAKRSNRDGVLLQAIAQRVRTQTHEPALLFVISDGQPSGLDYGGDDAIEHTAAVVKAIEQDGFTPVQIGIDSNQEIQQRMYKRWVNFSNPADLSRQLTHLLKSNLPSMAA